MLLVRVLLPDRPGSLGAVASAMGTVGADIAAMEVVEKRPDGTAVDDFMLSLPAGAMPDSVVSACNALAGVRVQWLSYYPEHWGLESDIHLLNDMTAEHEQAAEILVEGSPVVFHCQWGLLVSRGEQRRVLFSTPLAPDLMHEFLAGLPLEAPGRAEFEAGWLPDWPDTVIAFAPLRGDRSVIIGRLGGPAFLDSELARLRHLAALAG